LHQGSTPAPVRLWPAPAIPLARTDVALAGAGGVAEHQKIPVEWWFYGGFVLF